MFFVIQMKGVRYFAPNMDTHPAFGEALREAAENGVQVVAYDCDVALDAIEIRKEVPVVLAEPVLYEMVNPLVQWYRENKRDLPWRKNILRAFTQSATAREGVVPMLISASKYEVFLKVAELGSLTKAAQTLGYTQSNVSHIINTLEAEFGFPLFSRGRCGARLTPNGERVLSAVRGVVSSSERLQQTVSALRGMEAGTVRIGAFTSVAVHWLPGMIKAFTQDYPQIDFGLANGDYHDVEQWLTMGTVDLGFVTLPTSLDCPCIPLLEDRLMMVVPRDHRLADAPFYPLSELGGERFISLLENSDHDMRRVLEQAHVQPNVRFVTKDDYAIIAMIENGLGVSIMPELLLRNRASNVRVLPLENNPTRTIALAIPEVSSDTPCTRRFAEYVQTWVKADTAARQS